MTSLVRPQPRPDELAGPFWSAAESGVLAIQRCLRCSTYQHPPRPLCRACGGTDLHFEPVSGRGHLWSWTVTHHSVLAGLEPALPYTCMLVELVEQDQLIVASDLIGREHLADGLRIGMPMRLAFADPDAGEVRLPQFEPIGAAAQADPAGPAQ